MMLRLHSRYGIAAAQNGITNFRWSLRQTNNLAFTTTVELLILQGLYSKSLFHHEFFSAYINTTQHHMILLEAPREVVPNETALPSKNADNR